MPLQAEQLTQLPISLWPPVPLQRGHTARTIRTSRIMIASRSIGGLLVLPWSHAANASGSNRSVDTGFIASRIFKRGNGRRQARECLSSSLLLDGEPVLERDSEGVGLA